MRQRRFALAPFGCGLAALVGLAALAAHIEPVAQAKVPELPVSCGQKGRVVFDKDTVLSDVSGRRVARFSGGESAVTFVSPPAAGSDLARIETGTGQGSFRIHGFVKASELRIYTGTSIQLVPGHVWLRPGTRVMATGSAAGKVKVEKQISAPFNQRFSALADCSALTFSPPPPSGFSTPGNARVYLMKIALLDLYDAPAPQGSIVFTVQRAASTDNVRFFSTEQRGGFVHVQYGAELGIDAWAKASDLQALPRGETSDVAPSTYTMTSPPQLQLQKTPRSVRTKGELPLRVAARDAEAAVGVIEPETDIFVIDIVAGWANVLPQSLHILPADTLSFWVKSADLGL
jgi:hypothetical protein